MEPNLADPENLIMTRPPGSAIFAKVKPRDGAYEVAFMVREESERIPVLGKQVSLRVALLEQNGVGLVPILLSVGAEDKDIFETWLNYYALDKNGKKNDHLELLSQQSRIPIVFYGESGRERSIQIKNNTKGGLVKILDKVSKFPGWSMRDFDVARGEIYSRYDTVRKLWNGLNLT